MAELSSCRAACLFTCPDVLHKGFIYLAVTLSLYVVHSTLLTDILLYDLIRKVSATRFAPTVISCTCDATRSTIVRKHCVHKSCVHFLNKSFKIQIMSFVPIDIYRMCTAVAMRHEKSIRLVFQSRNFYCPFVP